MMPWAAIARLQVPGVSRCTAVIVQPNFAVTAAHCLTKPGLGHFVQASSIHILLGYSGGGFTRHIVPDAVILPRGASAAGSPHGADFALLHFAPPAVRTLPLDATAVAPGTALLLAGFNQDRIERMAVDPACHALGVSAGETPVLGHNCAGTHGTSGGPLLVGDDAAGYRVAGIQVAGWDGAGGVAVPAATIRRMLPEN